MSAFSFRRCAALCKKEGLQIVRDPSSILIAFVLPAVLLLIFGYGVNLDTNRTEFGLLIQDAGQQADRVASVMEGSPYVRAHVGYDRTDMEERLRQGKIRALLVLPETFSRDFAHGGKAAQAQLLLDGAEPNTANFATAYARSILKLWQAQHQTDKALEAQSPALPQPMPRYWFNPSTVSRNYLVPGSISIVMTIIGVLLTSLVVAREWERGTMEGLLSTPVTRTEFLISKIAPYYVLGITAMAMCVSFATLVIGVPLRGSLLCLFVFTSLFLLCALGMGLLVSTLTRKQFDAAQVALLIGFLPAIMLSGFIFEIQSMPPVLRWLTYLIPARYFVSALQTIFQSGEIWSSLFPEFLFLAGSACLWIGLTALNTRRRLDGR